MITWLVNIVVNVYKWIISLFNRTNGGYTVAELLVDGGMETWTDSSHLTNWTFSATSGGTLVRESTTKHGGNYSAKIDTSTQGCSLLQKLTSAGYLIGKRVTLSGWVKADTSSAEFIIDAYDAGEVNNLASAAIQYSGSGNWEKLTVSLVVPRWTDVIWFNCQTMSGTVTAYWDDLTASAFTVSNIALNCSVTGSTTPGSNEFGVPADTNDGNIESAFGDASLGASLSDYLVCEYDFGGTFDISAMREYWRGGDQFTLLTISLYYGGSWHVVDTQATPLGDGTNPSITDQSGSWSGVTKAKVEIDSDSGTGPSRLAYCDLYEFEVYGPSNTRTVSPFPMFFQT